MKITLITLIFAIYTAPILAETFKLPSGTTFRAHADGFDCGSFGPESDYVSSPTSYTDRSVEFVQLAADKELNNFLIELTFIGKNKSLCTYGAFFIRIREEVRLHLDYSELVASKDESDCMETKAWLDNSFKSVQYQASKRGFRYVAVTLIENQQNNICTSDNVRVVFDRR